MQTAARRPRAWIDPWIRPLLAVGPRPAIALSVLVLLIPLAFVLVVPHPLEQPFGVDFTLYRDATARWLGGGSFYEPYQLAGPYDIRAGDILYPPVALWLFVPFALSVVPWAVAAIAWWAIPLGITAGVVGALRPRPVAWPLIALCVSNPTTLLKVWTGNPVIWSVAFLALAATGTSRFFAPFVLLKPSLAPFALFGVAGRRRRTWWAGLAMMVALALPFGGLWGDWVATLTNSRGGGLLYSALEIPMLLVPLVAWAGRTRRG